MKCYIKVAKIHDILSKNVENGCLEFRGRGVFCNDKLVIARKNQSAMPYYWFEDKDAVVTFHMDYNILKSFVNDKIDQLTGNEEDRNYFLFTYNERTTNEFRFQYKLLSKEKEREMKFG